MNRLLLLSLLFIALRAGAQDTCVTTEPYGSHPAGAFADVNGIRMYYEQYGPVGAPSLLLIHGNGGSVRSMRCQIEYFKSTYRVLVADSRYQGRSSNGTARLTYELMADDYAALLRYLKLDSVYVLGQSDGAILTLLLGIRHPGAMKKGIAMAPNLRPDSTALYGRIVRAGKRLTDSLGKAHRRNPGDAALDREYAWNKLMDEEPNIPTKTLSRINVPILLMSSDGDAITLEHMVEMYRALPKANLLVMPAATHGMLRQEHALFNQMCARFLSKPFSRPETAF